MGFNQIVQNFPMISIIISFIGVVVCSLLPRKAARYTTLAIEIVVIILGAFLMYLTISTKVIYRYSMGHFPAPFDNEIRFSTIESILATLFPAIMFFSILVGIKKIEEDISQEKEKYLYVLLNLVQVALLALVYTNDIFTGYVFLEISTLASVGLVMIKEKGHTLAAAIRYLIFNLLGSGLFLIGCVLLYDLTGYLSMEYIMREITNLVAEGKSLPMITCTFSLISIGLGVKSGMFPFYFWMPDTYGEATTTSSCVVSGLVSKGYIFLLIKFIYRTFGWENIYQTNMLTILFIFGILGMIIGSISAMRQPKINQMIALSSAAQIGYIYMGIGLGEIGMIASIFQIICHAITKPLLFASASGLISSSKEKSDFVSLRGAAYRNPIAGVAFTVGSLSMVGFPIFAGFIVKFLFIQASLSSSVTKTKLIFAITALIISTLLNTIYYLSRVMTIYKPLEKPLTQKPKINYVYMVGLLGFVLLNIFFGTSSQFVDDILSISTSLLG